MNSSYETILRQWNDPDADLDDAAHWHMESANLSNWGDIADEGCRLLRPMLGNDLSLGHVAEAIIRAVAAQAAFAAGYRPVDGHRSKFRTRQLAGRDVEHAFHTSRRRTRTSVAIADD